MRKPVRLQKLILLALIASMTGCASVDFDYPKTSSSAIEAGSDTYLGRALESAGVDRTGESGFRLLTDGIEALAARLLLAERAEKTLDVQYYLITNDPIGIAFIGSLLEGGRSRRAGAPAAGRYTDPGI